MDKSTEWRYRKTISFLSKHCQAPKKVLDLGITNPLSDRMKRVGYDVFNTKGENLDIDFKSVISKDFDLVTAFEIFEHMLAPFNILSHIKSKKLIASVPLRLWFSSAYWNHSDDWDKHYHEFEVKQFNLLLEKTNWKIIHSEKWKPYKKLELGIRPVLRMFTNRYYIVYCERV